MLTKPKVIFTDVSKKYNLQNGSGNKLRELISPRSNRKSFYALRNLSFSVNEGESIGIIGINGSGKSTLSNLLAQVVPPTTGDIVLNGEPSLIAISVGLNNNLTGLENIELKCLMHGLKKEEIAKLTPEIIDFAEIGDFIDQPVKNYSSGMKARLGFAISAHTNPDIMIIDEALSVGDPTFTEKCLNRMNQFKEEGKTIFFISHSTSQVRAFCDKVMWLHYGELVDYGETGKVLKKYKQFIAEFNNLNDEEKKAYKKGKIAFQKTNDHLQKTDSSIGKRSSSKKEKKKKKKSTFIGLFILLMMFVYSALMVVSDRANVLKIGMDSLKDSGSEIQSAQAKTDKVKPKAPSEKPKSEKQISTVNVNKAGIVVAGQSKLFRGSNLKTSMGNINFSDEVYILEKKGNVYKVRTEDKRVAYTKVENVKFLEEDLPVSEKRIEDFLPLFSERFTNAYGYFLVFLNSDYDEIKSSLGGLASEDTKENGSKVLNYPDYQAQMVVDKENMADSIILSDIGDDQDSWNQLKESASLTSKDEKLYYFNTEVYKIVIDVESHTAMIALKAESKKE